LGCWGVGVLGWCKADQGPATFKGAATPAAAGRSGQARLGQPKPKAYTRACPRTTPFFDRPSRPRGPAHQDLADVAAGVGQVGVAHRHVDAPALGARDADRPGPEGKGGVAERRAGRVGRGEACCQLCGGLRTLATHALCVSASIPFPRSKRRVLVGVRGVQHTRTHTTNPPETPSPKLIASPPWPPHCRKIWLSK
jgi:hypothetical protein